MSYLTNQILRGVETIRRNSREEWKERAEKAEAEVERLREQLDRAIQIAEETWELEGYADKDLKAELDRIKEAIRYNK